MSWSQLTIVVDALQVDGVSAMLEMFLAQAITTENAGEDEFYEVAFPGTPGWHKVRVTALFDDAIELAPIIDFVSQQLTSDNGVEVPISVSQLVDQDWERVWLDSFKPIEVGDNLWVCPSWCDPTEPTARNIRLDPGLAFGTGTHATTAMCLNWLATQDLSNQTVLDYGSGSGILAIGALFSEASHADAVDIDPLAMQACISNAERNNVADTMTAFLPNQLADISPAPKYDLVIANILAEVIIELHDTLLLHLNSGGTLLLTGILNTQTDKVIAAFDHQLSFEIESKDHWCLLVGTQLEHS